MELFTVPERVWATAKEVSTRAMSANATATCRPVSLKAPLRSAKLPTLGVSVCRWQSSHYFASEWWRVRFSKSSGRLEIFLFLCTHPIGWKRGEPLRKSHFGIQGSSPEAAKKHTSRPANASEPAAKTQAASRGAEPADAALYPVISAVGPHRIDGIVVSRLRSEAVHAHTENRRRMVSV